MWTDPALGKAVLQRGDSLVDANDACSSRLELIIDRIAGSVAAYPDAIAACDGSSEITYRRLMDTAGGLAVELRAKGASADAPVAICLPRSADLVVAIVAALRAGAAFLPLDPAWPIKRIRTVLEDARASVVFVSAALAPELADGRCQLLVLDPAVGSKESAASITDHAHPRDDDLAYMVYTSGSTGTPKGVEITHGNLANLLAWHISTFAVDPRDRVSCVAGLSYDALVWEVLPALAAGASLHMVPEDIRGSPRQLQKWLVQEAITVAFVPTAVAETMLMLDWPAETALRTLLTGGDALHVWPKPGLPFAVVNNYGPSECTVVATSITLSPGSRSGLPPIGRPIAHTQIHILDDHARPVPVGEVGEICISGRSVGRGYRNQPALTGEKFVSQSSPEQADASQRFYRTGDLGLLTREGCVEFHGRCDDQLKVRGHRIEPDEIAAALNRHPLVSQSAVVGHGKGTQRQLLAYVVLETDSLPAAPDLRDFLADSLPDYMLPELFVRIASLPQTANGKVDRKALPAPTPANALPMARYRPPASPIEIRLAAMVEALLGIDRVGADDNFFLIGGHSLLGTQLVMRLREAFGADLKLRDLFEAPTIAALARRVEQEVTRMVASMDEDEVRHRLKEA